MEVAHLGRSCPPPLSCSERAGLGSSGQTIWEPTAPAASRWAHSAPRRARSLCGASAGLSRPGRQLGSHSATWHGGQRLSTPDTAENMPEGHETQGCEPLQAVVRPGPPCPAPTVWLMSRVYCHISSRREGGPRAQSAPPPSASPSCSSPAHRAAAHAGQHHTALTPEREPPCTVPGAEETPHPSF